MLKPSTNLSFQSSRCGARPEERVRRRRSSAPWGDSWMGAWSPIIQHSTLWQRSGNSTRPLAPSKWGQPAAALLVWWSLWEQVRPLRIESLQQNYPARWTTSLITQSALTVAAMLTFLWMCFFDAFHCERNARVILNFRILKFFSSLKSLSSVRKV